MERRAILSSCVGIVSSIGLVGCSSVGIGDNTPERLQIEAEETSVCTICDQAIQEIGELEPREQAPAKSAIKSGSAVADFSGRRSVYVKMKGKFYFIDVSPGESEDYVFSLEAERETFDSMCELVRRNLITTVDEQSVTAGTYQTVEQTVKTGSFEAAPLDEPATETLNFLADIDSGRGNHPIYVAFEDDYYVLDFHYRSGE